MGKKKKQPDQKTFMNDAEKIMRHYAKQNKDLIVWRGDQDNGKSHLNIYEDTIIAGMGEYTSSSPEIPVMKVWLEGETARIEFTAGTEEDTTRWCPFGGGWIPLEEVEKIAKKLPDLFQ